jgi:hypothetical protein
MERAKGAALADVMNHFWSWLMEQSVYPVPVTGSMTYGADAVTVELVAWPEMYGEAQSA